MGRGRYWSILPSPPTLTVLLAQVLIDYISCGYFACLMELLQPYSHSLHLGTPYSVHFFSVSVCAAAVLQLTDRASAQPPWGLGIPSHSPSHQVIRVITLASAALIIIIIITSPHPFFRTAEVMDQSRTWRYRAGRP